MTEQIETMARAAHECNRAWCIHYGDTSQHPWETAEDWQKASARRGITSVLAGATPEQQHEAWATDKYNDGWRYGPKKDVTAKTHPCLVPYRELPEAQRAKDAIYIAVVKAFALAFGCEFTQGIEARHD
jgi:hypothetical protein